MTDLRKKKSKQYSWAALLVIIFLPKPLRKDKISLPLHHPLLQNPLWRSFGPDGDETPEGCSQDQVCGIKLDCYRIN
jgi:hypothetical protein